MLTSGNLYYSVVLFFNANRTLICNRAVPCGIHEQLSCPSCGSSSDWRCRCYSCPASLSSVHLKPLLTLLELCAPQLSCAPHSCSSCLSSPLRATQADFQRSLTTRPGPLYADIYPWVISLSWPLVIMGDINNVIYPS